MRAAAERRINDSADFRWGSFNSVVNSKGIGMRSNEIPQLGQWAIQEIKESCMVRPQTGHALCAKVACIKKIDVSKR